MDLSNGIRMRKRVLIGISLLWLLMTTISAPISMVTEYTVKAHVSGTESGVLAFGNEEIPYDAVTIETDKFLAPSSCKNLYGTCIPEEVKIIILKEDPPDQVTEFVSPDTFGPYKKEHRIEFSIDRPIKLLFGPSDSISESQECVLAIITTPMDFVQPISRASIALGITQSQLIEIADEGHPTWVAFLKGLPFVGAAEECGLISVQEYFIPGYNVLEGVPTISQGGKPWCAWASAAIVLGYYGYRGATLEQIGKDTYETANYTWDEEEGLPLHMIDEYLDTIEHLSGDHLTHEEITARGREELLKEIKIAINSGYPIILISDGAWLFEFNIPPVINIRWPSDLHASVIVGYSYSKEGLIKEFPITGVEPPAIRVHDPAAKVYSFGSYWVNYNQLFEKTVKADNLRLFIIKGEKIEKKEENWIDSLVNFFGRIIDPVVTFFTEKIPDFFRDLISGEESVEEKAIRNVERELDMISKGTGLISELQKSIYEVSEEEIPEEYLQFEFKYTIQGARFFTNVDEARNYMNSMGISRYDMNDALSIVTELELDQLGFCIVVVDYYLNIAGDAEEGRYPVVCDEEGTPFWESWHLYEDIQEMYEEIEQESYGPEYYEAEQLVLVKQDLKSTRLRICIRNPGAVDAVIIAIYRNGTFIATIDKLLRRNSTTCFELPGSYYVGDHITLVTEEGTQIKFKVK